MNDFKFLDENGKMSKDFERFLERDLSPLELQDAARQIMEEATKKGIGASLKPDTALSNSNASATSNDASNSASKSGR